MAGLSTFKLAKCFIRSSTLGFSGWFLEIEFALVWCAARFAPADPRQQNVTGGGPTIWQGGTAPTIFNDKLYVVTGGQAKLSRISLHSRSTA